MAVTLSTTPARLGTVKDPEAVQRLVRLPALMETSAGIPGIMVALIDGPLARNHPDLASKTRKLGYHAPPLGDTALIISSKIWLHTLEQLRIRAVESMQDGDRNKSGTAHTIRKTE